MSVSGVSSPLHSVVVDALLLLLSELSSGVVSTLDPLEAFGVFVTLWGVGIVVLSVSGVLEDLVQSPGVVCPWLMGDLSLWSGVESALVLSSSWDLSWSCWWAKDNKWISVLSLKWTLRKLLEATILSASEASVVLVVMLASSGGEAVELHKLIRVWLGGGLGIGDMTEENSQYNLALMLHHIKINKL